MSTEDTTFLEIWSAISNFDYAALGYSFVSFSEGTQIDASRLTALQILPLSDNGLYDMDGNGDLAFRSFTISLTTVGQGNNPILDMVPMHNKVLDLMSAIADPFGIKNTDISNTGYTFGTAIVAGSAGTETASGVTTEVTFKYLTQGN